MTPLLLLALAAAQPDADTTLAARLAPLIKAHKGQVAVGVKHLSTGESYFVGWSGACTGTGVCNLDMTQNRSVTATFDTMPFLDGFETGNTSRWSATVP